jgi:hypothetical protein
MRVLVACEFSGVVRRAFCAKGHQAWSCDLLPAEDGDPWHIQGDVRDYLKPPQAWDLLIAHPPCTYLTKAGSRWLYTGGRGNVPDAERWSNMRAAAEFFYDLLRAPVPKVAVENPVMHRHATYIIGRKQDQIIHPWEHGHQERKATGLWLRGLDPLWPTKIVGPPPKDRERKTWDRVHYAAPGPNRWKERSRTLEGVAAAMADQWGGSPGYSLVSDATEPGHSLAGAAA